MKSLHMQPIHLGKETLLDLETQKTRSVGYRAAPNTPTTAKRFSTMEKFTNPRLCVAIEAKQPYIRETLKPFEQAGFFVYNLHNDYMWVVENKFKPVTRVSFEKLYEENYMVDVLLSRTELPLDKLN
jgi:hypothetical protein